MRSLIKFALAYLPSGSVVNSARLSLYLAGATTEDSPMDITAYRIPNTWDESITWNGHLSLSVDPNHAAAVPVGTQFGWYTWDLTPMVQAWANDPNRGNELAILLRGHPGPDSRRRAFWSKDCADSDCQGNRPKLDIQFAAPTATPTQTHTATPTRVPPTATPTVTPTPTPTPGASVSMAVEPVFPYGVEMAIVAGTRITYTIAVANGNTPLNNVLLYADAEIDTGAIPPMYLWPEEPVNDGAVVDRNSKHVVWTIGNLQPNQQLTRTYVIVIPSSPWLDGRNLYLPVQYMRNDGAILVWAYGQPPVAGSAYTPPLRNPPMPVYKLLVPMIRRQ